MLTNSLPTVPNFPELATSSAETNYKKTKRAGVERWNASNIVWSNGEYDPWAGGGVPRNVSAESTGLWAISIPAAAHHLDLMWSDPGDTDAVRRARDFEMGQVRHWIDAKKEVHDSQILQAAQK